MINSQKSQIIEFRKKGLGYKTIAAILEITKDSVSGFCRRTGMNGEISERGKKNNICQSCGRVIPESIIDRKKRFCSNKCRMTWWNTSTEKQNQQPVNAVARHTMHTQTRDSVHMNAMFYTVSVESGHANDLLPKKVTDFYRCRKVKIVTLYGCGEQNV